MVNKFYAVRKGKKTGIFTTWDECKKQVMRYSGAEYKSFKNKEDAEEYLNISNNGQSRQREEKLDIEGSRKENNTRNINKEAIAYVDGSYNNKTKEFTYGAVIFWNSKEYHFSAKFVNEELAKMHNVAGELKGSERAIKFALENKIDTITIYYDYEGIAKWCTGEWKTKKEGTKAYKDFYNKAKQRVKINFVKVKAHSGDRYNELADKLAKEAFFNPIEK